jgi:CBS domain containing-hemolysin-like protein
MYPARILVRKITDATLSLLVRDAAARGDHLSEKELQVLIQIGQEEGILEKAEGKRLDRLFELGDRSVKEIMTPRTDLIAFDIRGKRDALHHLLENYHYTYLPVFRDSPDQILGVISVQEVMLNPDRAVAEFLRPPYYVPETKKIDELLFEMRKDKVPFAICVDEFGGTSGLVTHEDIVEEIFGEIYDEHSKEERLIKKLGRDEFLINGRVSLKDLNEAVGAHFRSPSSETLNGFILEKLGRIPKPKETLRLGDFLFEVKEMEKRRIKKVALKRLR